jgi:hypothetical protein
MKAILFKSFMLAMLVLGGSALFGQTASLKGKAMAAANGCISSFGYPGLGLQMVTTLDVVGPCGRDGNQYAVNIMRVGHCPGNDDILCLVIAMPIARVVFDCNEEVVSVECFND